MSISYLIFYILKKINRIIDPSTKSSPNKPKQETLTVTKTEESSIVAAKKFYASNQSNQQQQQQAQQKRDQQNQQNQQKQVATKTATSSSLSTWQANLASQLALPDDFTPELISQLASEGYDVVSATGRKPRSRAIQQQV